MTLLPHKSTSHCVLSQSVVRRMVLVLLLYSSVEIFHVSSSLTRCLMVGHV